MFCFFARSTTSTLIQALLPLPYFQPFSNPFFPSRRLSILKMWTNAKKLDPFRLAVEAVVRNSEIGYVYILGKPTEKCP